MSSEICWTFQNSSLLEHLWGEFLFLLGIYDILQVFSTKLLKQLPWRRSIKTIIILLTKQIKIQKIVETFFWKIFMVEYCFHNSQGHITEIGLKHWRFSWKFFFYNCRAHSPACRAHGIIFFWSWDAFPVFDRKPFLYRFSEPAFFFFLPGFSFTNIHESRHCISLTPHYYFHSFTDT